jgi:hypothetical protein
MLTATLYIITSFLIVRGIMHDLSKYVLICPYIIYSSFAILDIIPNHGGVFEYSSFDSSISEKALYIQSTFVLSYIFLVYTFSARKNETINKDKLISEINKLGKLVDWEKIINVISFISLLFLIYYLPTHLSSVSSLNYNISGGEIRDIPYVSLLLNLSNAIYILIYYTKDSKVNALTLLGMLVPSFVLSTLGIRLFLFRLIWLIFLTNFTEYYELASKMLSFLFLKKLDLKAILRFVIYSVTAYFLFSYIVRVFTNRIGEAWNTSFIRVIFQETVYNNIGFFSAIEYGGAENIDNFVRCSLISISKEGCEIQGVLGISSLWAEVFSYKYEDAFILLILLVIFSFLAYIALNSCLERYPWLFIISLSSISSGIFDLWRSSLTIGLSIIIKCFLALTMIIVIATIVKSTSKKIL